MSSYKDQIIQYFKTVELDYPRILSIGGQEDDRKYFKSVECDEWKLLDIDQKFNPDILFDINRPFDGDVLEIPEDYVEYFDCVVALNLWEYIYDPMTAHRNIYNLLKQGGVLITNYPFVYPLHKPEGNDYLRFTPEGAEKILYKSGFKVQWHGFIYGTDDLVGYYIKDGLKARAGFDHKVIGSIIKARKE